MTTEPIAEVIKRYRETADPYEYRIDSIQVRDDLFAIADYTLREHDTSPITPELLLADGWLPVGTNGTYRYGSFHIQMNFGSKPITTLITGIGEELKVHTIGDARSLVRVFGSHA